MPEHGGRPAVGVAGRGVVAGGGGPVALVDAALGEGVPGVEPRVVVARLDLGRR